MHAGVPIHVVHHGKPGAKHNHDTRGVADPHFEQGVAGAPTAQDLRRAKPQPDEDILAKAMADAGLNAFGCVHVEMWVFSDDGTEILRPPGGHWMNPAFASSLPSEERIEKAWALDRHAEATPPGVGLAGILLDESGLSNGQVYW